MEKATIRVIFFAAFRNKTVTVTKYIYCTIEPEYSKQLNLLSVLPGFYKVKYRFSSQRQNFKGAVSNCGEI